MIVRFELSTMSSLYTVLDTVVIYCEVVVVLYVDAVWLL